MGRERPVTWPPLSPNLTFLDFFICRSIKETVDGTEVRNCDDVISTSRKPLRTSAVMLRRYWTFSLPRLRSLRTYASSLKTYQKILVLEACCILGCDVMQSVEFYSFTDRPTPSFCTVQALKGHCSKPLRNFYRTTCFIPYNKIIFTGAVIAPKNSNHINICFTFFVVKS